MAKSTKFIGCQVKKLPEHKREEAAATAIEQNPANRPHVELLSVAMTSGLDEQGEPFQIEPAAFLSVLTSKYWGTGGVKLGVSFMETTTQELRDKIIAHMNAWNQWCNVQFAYSQSGGEVRISRGPGGYYSYLGTDVLHIPKNQQTMNLEGFTLKTPDSEYKRVVRHETGHTLGFPHEHMRRQIVAKLDEAKTIAYFAKNQGWDEQEVRQQVLTALDDSSIMGTPDADEVSIMCYQLPGQITKDGKPIPGGVDIEAQDQAFAAKLYPLSVTPPLPSSGSKRILITWDNAVDLKNPKLTVG